MASEQLFSLAGKSAVVTGAGSGIGEAIALRFAAAGARVWAADLKLESVERVAAEIGAAGGRAEPVALDVADAAACRAFAERVEGAAGGALDVLVNNAGIGHVGTILKTEWVDLERLQRVNVGGMFHLSKAFLPAMLARGRGSIINLASIGGVMGVKDRVAYCATKFAVVGITKAMAMDHATSGVRINAICPARVMTPFVEARLKEYPDPAAAYREMSASQPVGRMATPGEIAAAAHYLAADESAFVTGSALLVDGAFSAGR